ncbi:MAG: hypothetical protein M1838_004034 [Thelocarpon superellum]|nr:MAG: hypothetical protein M1838_004034 [Thelocarpon superellum]
MHFQLALRSLWLVLFLLFNLTAAQFVSADAANNNVTTIHSPVNGNISITYKAPPPGTCTTIFPTQQQYVGHVSLPPFTLAPIQQNYSINTFFWFIEARQNASTAPLTIWLNGGPGSSSMVGLFQETGPCEVVELAKGKFGTTARDWGWDRSSNLLYIDEPNEVGFSFDTPTEGSLNLLTGDFLFPPRDPPSNQAPISFLNGSFSSNNANHTSNTTDISAQAVWHMLQAWLGVYPQYNPGTRPDTNLTDPAGINLFAESYGGKYGPAFAYFWEQQNIGRQNGTISSMGTVDLQLQSLGIMSGCVDDLIQAPFYPIMASNNTYGIQAISQDVELTAAESFQNQGGCQAAISACRAAVAAQDPFDHGDVSSVNALCKSALLDCNQNVLSPYMDSNRSIYDITHMVPDPFPPSAYLEYLNTEDFLAAIGSPINYTESSGTVQGALIATGDWERGNQISALSYLLSNNVRVALIYGDRDYVCNWLGGEAVSFSVAGTLPDAYGPFYGAGYADIVVNSSYIGGQVRQFGNLSFTRVYDAGHLIPAYQPETAFTVFTRVMTGVNIATGEPVNLTSFGTQGDANSTHTNSAPPSPDPTCWLRDVAQKCTDQQKSMIQKGQGVIINGVLYDQESDWPIPPASIVSEAGVPGSFPSAEASAVSAQDSMSGSGSSPTSSIPTGVYVATGPFSKPTKTGAAPRAFHLNAFLLLGSFGLGWAATAQL